MRSIILFNYTLCLCICASPTTAQDRIYLATEQKEGKVIEITADKIRYKNPQNPGPVYSISRDKVLFLFSNSGHYCVPGNAEHEVAFTRSIQGNGSVPVTDQLITTAGVRINCRIDKEEGAQVFYTDNGAAKNIDAASLVAVIYKNGTHKILKTDYALVAAALKKGSSAESVAAAKPAVSANNIISIETEPVKASALPAQPVPSQAAPVQATPAQAAPTKTTVINTSNVPASAAPVEPVAPASSNASATKAKPREFSTEELGVDFKEYERKALDKTKELSDYLKILCDKNTEYDRAEQAINQACQLFVNEEATVSVSSIARQGKVHYKIRDYFKKLKLIKYGKVEIEWTNIQYVSKLRKGPDGNYYGVITFEQVFRGYMDNQVVYTDVTRKNIEIVLKAQSKSVEGRTSSTWTVLLSDIGVVETKHS